MTSKPSSMDGSIFPTLEFISVLRSNLLEQTEDG